MNSIPLDTLFLGLALIACLIWAVFGVLRHKSNWRETYAKRFEGREPLSEDQFLNSFYSDKNLDKRVIWRIASVMARHYHVSPGQLRPTDSFFKELSPPDSFFRGHWSSRMGIQGVLREVVTDFSAEYSKIRMPDTDIVTVDDFIRALEQGIRNGIKSPQA